MLFNQPEQKTISGAIVSVYDGDTVTLVETGSGEKYTIRLEGIDAPEKKQEFGEKSREKLNELVLLRQVNIKVVNIDKYGRTVGIIYKSNLNINRHMVLFGYAWHYKAYSKDEKLANAEKIAKDKKRGLWSTENPVPPWVWRAKQKRKGAVKIHEIEVYKTLFETVLYYR